MQSFIPIMNLWLKKVINRKIRINNFLLKNRVIVGPMCQYSAINGRPSKWHFIHLNKLCKSGASLVMLESTAVNRQGRISRKDLVLENKKDANSLKKIFTFLKKNKIKIGLQISHSGRKGSTNLPWIKKGVPLKKNEGSWKTVSPSAIKRDKKWPTPREMSQLEI